MQLATPASCPPRESSPSSVFALKTFSHPQTRTRLQTLRPLPLILPTLSVRDSECNLRLRVAWASAHDVRPHGHIPACSPARQFLVLWSSSVALTRKHIYLSMCDSECDPRLRMARQAHTLPSQFLTHTLSTLNSVLTPDRPVAFVLSCSVALTQKHILPPACVIPNATYGYGWQGQAHTISAYLCKPLVVLDSGVSCTVECQDDFIAIANETANTYACTNGSLSVPTLACGICLH